MTALNSKARFFPVSSRNFLAVLVLALLTGCAGSNVPQFVYQWTPDAVPAPGSIDAGALIETEHQLSPELAQTWRNWMNTEQNIVNYRAAVSDALFEDMRRSNIFAGATRSPQEPHDLLVRIASAETKKEEHYLFTVAVKVIDPRSGKEVLAYRREADLGTSFFSNNLHLRKELSQQLADIRTAMLNDFSGAESPGRLAFFAPRPEAAPPSQPEPAVAAPPSPVAVPPSPVATPPSPAMKAPPGIKPSLWVLAIGVSAYQDSSLNLKYADNDARSIVHALMEQEGKLFSEVNGKLLLNENGTRENILDAMSKFLGMASYNDLVLIFIAGHGVKDRQTGSYYFMTHDATPDSLMTRGLLWSTFDEAHKRLAANVSKVMLWLDTCHAGAMNVAMRGLEAGEELSLALRSAEGTYILTASKPGENSEEGEAFRLEHEKSGHGAFTYSLLEGLTGKADMDGDRSISVSELSSYVAKKVPRLTQGRQHPYFRMSGTDMPIFMQE
ncbi:MAG TPA: hypothetical protein DDY20_11250 [Desulfobulbaceae bacterium]|nr:hypothetical protein [Desulfobulbaceae bacterium]